MIPHISIQKTESSNGTSGGALLDPLQKNKMLPVPAGAMSQEEESDELMDPTLDRYLKHGRRHTLGAAHNTMLVNPEDWKR